MIMVDAERTAEILQEKFGNQGVAVEVSGGPRDLMLRALVDATTLDDAKHLFHEALYNCGMKLRRVSFMPNSAPSDNGLQQVCIDMQ